MAVLIQDTFTSSNGTAIDSRTTDSGHSWVRWVVPNNPYNCNQLKIQTNRAYRVSTNPDEASSMPGSDHFIPTWTAPGADYKVVAVIRKLASGTDEANVGICARWVTPNGGYIFYYDNAGGRFVLSVLSASGGGGGGSFMDGPVRAPLCHHYYEHDPEEMPECADGPYDHTELDDATTALTVGQDYTMELYVVGNSISGYVDGALVCNASDTTYASAGFTGVKFSGLEDATSAGIHMASYQVESFSVDTTDGYVDEYYFDQGTYHSAKQPVARYGHIPPPTAAPATPWGEPPFYDSDWYDPEMEGS